MYLGLNRKRTSKLKNVESMNFATELKNSLGKIEMNVSKRIYLCFSCREENFIGWIWCMVHTQDAEAAAVGLA